MNPVRSVLAALALSLFVPNAPAQQVSYNFDQQANFATYKTYRWEQHPSSAGVDDLTMRQLTAAFDAELAKEGLTRVEGNTSDLVLVLQLALQEEKELTFWDSGWGYGPGWYGARYPGPSTATVSTITKGAVSLDMYDAAKKELVWRGVATKTVDPQAKVEKRLKNMKKTAEKMLKNFPPGTK